MVPAIFEQTACHWLNDSHVFCYVIVGHPCECAKSAAKRDEEGDIKRRTERWEGEEGKNTRARAYTTDIELILGELERNIEEG